MERTPYWHLPAALLVNAGFWGAIVVACIWPVAYNPFVAGALIFGGAVALVGSSLGVVIAHFQSRKLSIRRRLAAYAAPSVLILTILFLVIVLMPNPPPSPNQIQDVASPSGRYRLRVPIEQGFWQPTITDAEGKVEYVDRDGQFPGRFNVYWIWDAEDRAWLLNSDDGWVYCWWKINGIWRKIHVHENMTLPPEIDGPMPPAPPALFERD